MSRVVPNINIQTDIFNENQDYPEPKPHEDTKETDNFHREKASIYFESILTSLYLKKIYIPFKILAHHKRGLPRQIKISQSYIKSDAGEHDSDINERLNKYSRIIQRKKSNSYIERLSHSHSQDALKESRKLILENINDKLRQSKSKRSRSRDQQELVEKKIMRLQKLRQNIRNQKSRNYQPTKIHQQKYVSSIPKIQDQQMNIFLDELHKLRQEVTEIKEMNQIIYNSRAQSQVSQQNSVKSKSPFSNSAAFYQVNPKENYIREDSTNHQENISGRKHQYFYSTHQNPIGPQPFAVQVNSPGYTKPELLKQLGLNPFPESTETIKSFRFAENSEHPNGISGKSYNPWNEKSSFNYSKSSGRKMETQAIQTNTPKTFFNPSQPANRRQHVHSNTVSPPIHFRQPSHLSQFVQTNSGQKLSTMLHPQPIRQHSQAQLKVNRSFQHSYQPQRGFVKTFDAGK